MSKYSLYALSVNCSSAATYIQRHIKENYKTQIGITSQLVLTELPTVTNINSAFCE